jgi:hypothetical protein
MKQIRLISMICFTLMVAACGSHESGEEYLGTWKGVKGFNYANLTVVISRNGSNFIVDDGPSKASASLKEGVLKIETPLGAENLTIDKTSGHLLFAGDELERAFR